MTMKGYSMLPRSTNLEVHHQMQFSVIPRKPPSMGSYLSPRDAISIISYANGDSWVSTFHFFVPIQPECEVIISHLQPKKFGCVLWDINRFMLPNARFCFIPIHQIYLIWKRATCKQYFNEPELICLCTVKCFQVFLCNTKSIKHQPCVCTVKSF